MPTPENPIPLQHPEHFVLNGVSYYAMAYYDRRSDRGTPERVFVVHQANGPTLHFARPL